MSILPQKPRNLLDSNDFYILQKILLNNIKISKIPSMIQKSCWVGNWRVLIEFLHKDN